MALNMIFYLFWTAAVFVLILKFSNVEADAFEFTKGASNKVFSASCIVLGVTTLIISLSELSFLKLVSETIEYLSGGGFNNYQGYGRLAILLAYPGLLIAAGFLFSWRPARAVHLFSLYSLLIPLYLFYKELTTAFGSEMINLFRTPANLMANAVFSIFGCIYLFLRLTFLK